MSVLPAGLRSRIASRHYTVTRTELAEVGVPPSDVARWLACRVLVELAPGVLCVADAERLDPFGTRAAARCLSDPTIVCDALTSAQVWGLPGIFALSRPSTRLVDGVPARHVVDRADGLRVLSPAATWFALTRSLRPAHFDTWSTSVLGHEISVAEAHDVVRRWGDHRNAADRRAIAVLSSRRRWQRPGDVTLERRVRSSLRRRGLTGLDGTHTISLPSGVEVHPTAVDHEHRWGIEIDHRRWHRGRWSTATATWIDRQLRECGWTIVRVSDTSLRRNFLRAMNTALATRTRPEQAA